ncbi:hypothetical protein BD769DRAFT_1036037 [Suillus cothurnatus]|nr:hypothetical protein BD769DRAFT_1036037 [Suillus cothurnatus]
MSCLPHCHQLCNGDSWTRDGVLGWTKSVCGFKVFRLVSRPLGHRSEQCESQSQICTRITVLVCMAQTLLPLIVTHHDLDGRHVELFQNESFLPKDIVVRLREIVMYTQADSITFETSLTPLDSNEIASTLGLMDFLMNSTDRRYIYREILARNQIRSIREDWLQGSPVS